MTTIQNDPDYPNNQNNPRNRFNPPIESVLIQTSPHSAPPPRSSQTAQSLAVDPPSRSTPIDPGKPIAPNQDAFRKQEIVANNQTVPNASRQNRNNRDNRTARPPKIRGVQPLKSVLTSLNNQICQNDRPDGESPTSRNVRYNENFQTCPTPRTTRTDSDVCPECDGSGSIFSTRNGATFVRDCSCAIRGRQERLWKRAGFDRCNLDVPLGRTGQIFVDRFDSIRRSPRNWVLYAGKTGSGKTTQAGLIVRRLIERPNPVLSRMLSFFDLLRVTSGLWNSFRQEELSQKIEETFDVDLIVVDDFLKGARRDSNADFKATCGVMDYLYRIRKPVVLTTEFLPEEIAKFDGATAGRIVELCDGRIVTFDQNAENYRLRRFSPSPVFA